MVLRFQLKFLHIADDVGGNTAFNGGFVGVTFRGILKSEDDVIGEELGAIGFADDFVEVYPYEGNGVLLGIDPVEVVFAVEILDELLEEN